MQLLSKPPILCAHYVFSQAPRLCQAWIINNPWNCRWRADSTLVCVLMTKTIWFKCDPWRVRPYLSFPQGEVIEVTNSRTGWPAQSGSSSIVSFPSFPSGPSWKGPSTVSQAYWSTQEWFSLSVCAGAKLWKHAAVICCAALWWDVDSAAAFRKFTDLGGVRCCTPPRQCVATTTTTCQWLSKPTCARGDELACACALETVSVCRSAVQMLEQISSSMESQRHRRPPHSADAHAHTYAVAQALVQVQICSGESQECFEIYTLFCLSLSAFMMKDCVCISCANTNLSLFPSSWLCKIYIFCKSLSCAGEEVRFYHCFGGKSCVVILSGLSPLSSCECIHCILPGQACRSLHIS